MNLLGIGFATSVVSERVRFDRQPGAVLRRYGIAPVPHGDRAASGESGAVIDPNPIARGVIFAVFVGPFLILRLESSGWLMQSTEAKGVVPWP